MKRLFAGTFCLLFLLTMFGCSLPQAKPKTIEGSHYLDPNTPVVDIRFPFKVSLVDEKTVGNQGGDVSFTHKITTLRASKPQTFVHIDKISMDNLNAYWTGVNYETEELFYQDKRSSSNGCFVYHKAFSGEHFLIGDVIKYGFQRDATNIRVSQYFPSIYSAHDLRNDHKEEVNEMINVIKGLCAQVLE